MKRSIVLISILLLGAGPGAAGQGRGPVLATGDALKISVSDYRDRLKGGFVGQMAGVVYAAPYEFKFEGSIAPEWMLTGWSPAMMPGALIQDDVYVELTFLKTLEEHGLEVSPEQIGRDFAASRYPLWHANKAARDLLRAGVMPPLSGHPRLNPHADDIDFQIESDLFGLISPGMTQAAQELTWKFGHVMNYGDGVYGGVFIASMYSAAFFEPDRVKVVQAGLAAIPPESNYARTVRDVLAAYQNDPAAWKKAWQVIEQRWAGKLHCPERHPLYPWRRQGIGANVNGAYVVIGLLYGQGDPLATIRIATRCGRDCDCNASSAMGVLGAMIGFEALPPSFKSALPAMAGRKFAFSAYDWQSALAAMEKQALAQIQARGGREDSGSGQSLLTIPSTPPVQLPLEQWPYDVPGEEVN